MKITIVWLEYMVLRWHMHLFFAQNSQVEGPLLQLSFEGPCDFGDHAGPTSLSQKTP